MANDLELTINECLWIEAAAEMRIHTSPVTIDQAGLGRRVMEHRLRRVRAQYGKTPPDSWFKLSLRQKDLVRLLVSDNMADYVGVAKSMGLKVETVRVYATSIYKIMGCHRRIELYNLLNGCRLD